MTRNPIGITYFRSTVDSALSRVHTNSEVRPKMLSNVVSAAWTHMDKKWILPAVGTDGEGPIQESGGKVLTVVGNAVQLQDKKMYNKQKWKKEAVSVGDYFRLNHVDDSNPSNILHHYLTAVTTGTLAGKFIYYV